jgi:hypothetical protein
MADFSLYSRMQAQGTISEIPKDIPDVRFALPSTINWMRGLAILVENQNVNFEVARGFYAGRIQRRNMPDNQINSMCEQLLFALHQIAALSALLTTKNKADVVRMAIVAWYYGIYGSAAAMIAGADGSFQQTHKGTAVAWDRQFAENKILLDPFADRISNLLDKTIEVELTPIRKRGKHDMAVSSPENPEQGWGCVAAYLSGSAKWQQDALKETVKKSRDFRALGCSDFRKADAKALRDAEFNKHSLSFLHQAYRYRGKANYRDAIFLAYGKNVPKLVDGLVKDLHSVLIGFSSMAAGYAAVRLGKDIWEMFLNDLEVKRAVTSSPKSIWS